MKYLFFFACLKLFLRCWMSFLLCFCASSILYAQCPGFAGTISGADTVYQGQTMVSYTVPAIANATSYEWTLPPGAAITAGTATNSMMVSFSESATGGNITVKGINSCGAGLVSPPFKLIVKKVIPSIYSISGSTSVYQEQQGITYTVDIPNASQYIWELPAGATIAGEQDTSRIIVDYGSNAEKWKYYRNRTKACLSGDLHCTQRVINVK